MMYLLLNRETNAVPRIVRSFSVVDNGCVQRRTSVRSENGTIFRLVVISLPHNMRRTDAIATLPNGNRIEYLVADPDQLGSHKQTIVLIHGYPQTKCEPSLHVTLYLTSLQRYR
jgi:hypothetical protein